MLSLPDRSGMTANVRKATTKKTANETSDVLWVWRIIYRETKLLGRNAHEHPPAVIGVFTAQLFKSLLSSLDRASQLI
jgi:hypothetical protein